MGKKLLPIWYFVVTILILVLMQTTFMSSPGETIPYNQFKSLLKDGMVTDIVVSETTIRGQMGREGMRIVLPPERLGQLDRDQRETFPFIVVKVDDPKLIAHLEEAGIPFRGEVTSNWLSTLLSLTAFAGPSCRLLKKRSCRKPQRLWDFPDESANRRTNS